MRRKTMQRTRIARAVGAVLAAGAMTATAGCSGGSHSTTASSSTSAVPVSTAPAASAPASNTAWNPCSISDADIAASGLNPAKKEPDTGKYAQKFPGWDVCAWLSDSWYQLNVYSTNAHTFDEVVHNTTLFRDPQPVTVAGRSGMLLPSVSDPEDCTIAFDIPNDPIQLEVSAKISADSPGDACTEVTRISSVLAKDLPATGK